MEQITLTGWFVLYEINDELRLVAGCTEGEARALVARITANDGEVKAALPYDPFVGAVLAGLRAIDSNAFDEEE